MTKTILITGATDGIGLETAKHFVSLGHTVLIHGRNPDKLASVKAVLDSGATGAPVQAYRADLSKFSEVNAFAAALQQERPVIDVVINNAGIFKTPQPITEDGLDVRFVVNTLAPYLLTRRLLNKMPNDGRVINLSSAAQSPVNLNAMSGQVRLSDMDAYAQSKLAITMWTQEMARELPDGPMVVAVNPGSLLASKMVKEGFGLAGNDLSIGVDILTRAALSEEFASTSGKYFDNDLGQFAHAHSDAQNPARSEGVYAEVKALVAQFGGLSV